MIGRDLVVAGDVVTGEVVPAGGPRRSSVVPQHVLDNALSSDAQELIFMAKPPTTIKAYLHALRLYRSWCQREDVRRTWLPMTQNTGIEYLNSWRSLPIHVKCKRPDGHRPSPSAAWIWYSAIRWAHGIGDPPTPWEGGVRLSEAMDGYCTEMVDLGWKPDSAPPAYPDQLRRIIDTLDATPTTGGGDVVSPARKARDRARLLIGFYTGARASDLCTYRIDDVGYFPLGIDLTLTASKANKKKGRKVEHRTVHRRPEGPQYCGVSALDLWLGHLRDQGIRSGALFRPVHKSGEVVRGRADALTYKMDATAMTRIVPYWAVRAGIPGGENLTQHSLRRGRVRQLRMLDVDTWDIEQDLGWAHGGAIVAYLEEVERQRPDAVGGKGLL